MKQAITFSTAILLAAWGTGADAQSGAPSAPTATTKATTTTPGESTSKAATPSPAPAAAKSSNTVGGAGVGAIVDGKPRVCVVEPKPATKTVYGSNCREYCAPKCSVFKKLMSKFGCGDEDCCNNCDCCELLHRRVLTKKTVPACDTKACALKEVPACETAIQASTPAPVVVPIPTQSAPKPSR